VVRVTYNAEKKRKDHVSSAENKSQSVILQMARSKKKKRGVGEGPLIARESRRLMYIKRRKRGAQKRINSLHA